MYRGHAVTALPFCHLDPGHAVGAITDTGIARGKPGQTPVCPCRICFTMMHKALALKTPVRVGGSVWQCHVMINGGDMLGWHADFNHLDIF